MMSMKILLLNPSYKQDISNNYERYYIRSGSRWPHSGVKRKRTPPHYLPFPFFLAYSASLLKQSGFDVYAIDAVALDFSEADLLKQVENIKPHIIFYECTTPTAKYDLWLAKKIKEVIEVKIVIGGPHATIFASQILQENKCIDFIIKGEYEWAFMKLCQAIEQKSSFFLPGVVFCNKGEIIDQGRATLIEPLDELPAPLREIFPSNNQADPTIYWDGFCQRRPAIQMQSSRGCFYHCNFCLWKHTIYNGSRYRSFSSERVVNEMQDVVSKYRVKEIYFDDDDFAADKERAGTLCKYILESNVKINWSCMSNLSNLTEDIIDIMARSGCIGIKFGVESGSNKLLKYIGKPVDLKRVKEIVRYCSKQGIKTHATFCLGFLEETKEDIKETQRFINRLVSDSIQVSIVTPYPGTDLFAEVEKNDFLDSSRWEQYDGKRAGIVRFPRLDGKKIERIRRKVLFTWFLRRGLSLSWLFNHFLVLLRTLRGLGIHFFLKQFVAIGIDEWKNK